MIKTAKSALAHHWNMDYAEVKDYRYTGVQYNKPVYAIGNAYYCASRNKPAKEVGINITDELEWVEQKDDFVNKHGWKIFKATI